MKEVKVPNPWQPKLKKPDYVDEILTKINNGELKIKGQQHNPKPEKRKFIIHGHEFWFAKDELEKEFGCEPEDVDEIWEHMSEPEVPATIPVSVKETEKPKPEPKAEKPQPVKEKTAEPVAAVTVDQVLEAMKGMEGDITSTRLRDKFGTSRSYMRRLMKQLAKDGKVTVGTKGKRQQVYKFA